VSDFIVILFLRDTHKNNEEGKRSTYSTFYSGEQVNQLNLKAALFAITTPLTMLIAVAEPAAAKINCAKLGNKPPVVNHPTHIQNVIWRNKQAYCQYEKVIAKQQSR
jgi:hypothetical protein